MPEHLRAIIVILILAIPVFALGKPTACALAIPEDAYRRRRNLWFGITLAAFLAHDFWIFIILAGILTFIGAQQERNKLALFFFLFFAMSMITGRISILGVYIIDVHYGRLLSLTILLPALVTEPNKSNPQPPKFGSLVQDKILLLFLMLLLLLHLEVDETYGNKIRNYVIYPFTDVFLPYYVASRTLNNVRDFRDALMSFVMACMVLALIAVFEWGRHWLLYTSLKEALGVPWDFGKYLGRGSYLRALGTPGQAIALGYTLAVAFGAFLYFKKPAGRSTSWLLGASTLVAGMIAALSRGPWIGAVAMLGIFIITGPQALSNLAILGFLALAGLAVTAFTPAWDKIIDYLPFVGKVDAENVDFRQNLLTDGIDIILENPFFGARLLDLEQFRTGEGIIDIVNTYLNIGMSSGLTGLGLFVLFFSTTCLGIYKGMRSLPNKDDERHLLGRTLLSVLIGILVIICTVSSITVIPFIYWSFAGIGVAYIRLAKQPNATESTQSWANKKTKG